MKPDTENVMSVVALAAVPDVLAGIFVIVTRMFTDQAPRDAARPALADIPNFSSEQPVMLIGQVHGQAQCLHRFFTH